MIPDPLPHLQRVFGFPAFRGVQADVVARVLEAKRTLAVMPTGAGKSLCYQLPALAREGTALVISPLIALMHDQIRSADAYGIKAASLTSADANRSETIERFRGGDLDLLYVAPERATTDAFRQLIDQEMLALIAIDEAHCVSEWGHDFRPDYRLLLPLLDQRRDAVRLGVGGGGGARGEHGGEDQDEEHAPEERGGGHHGGRGRGDAGPQAPAAHPATSV